MSRVGRKPVQIPQGVNVELKNDRVIVNGPKGSLEVKVPSKIKVSIENEKIIVRREEENKKVRAFHGLIRQLLHNAVVGVSQGFKKQLDVIGTGYRAEVKGDELILRVGFSHPYVMKIPEDIKVSVEQLKTGDRNFRITVEGIDKQKVGQFAANIRRVRPPDVFVGKGIRYVGEEILRKPGKAAAKTGG